MTATNQNDDRQGKPRDLNVVDGGPKNRHVVYYKCRRCGYVFRTEDYWRRRKGWARGKVKKLMKKCIKCGHGKYYFHSPPWDVCQVRLKDNPLDASIQLMEIAGASDMRKVKNPYRFL